MSAQNEDSEALKLADEVRAIIAQVSPPASESTKAQYLGAMKRLLKGKVSAEVRAGTGNTFYAYRAAMVFYLTEQARNLLVKFDAIDPSSEQYLPLVRSLLSIHSGLKRYPPGPIERKSTDAKTIKWSNEARGREAKGQKLVKHSKRYSLKGLSDDWRMLMFSGLKASSEYLDIVATLSATGARPIEFESGIEVRVIDDHLCFLINGGKTHAGKFGQKWRSFEVRADRPELRYLQARVVASAGKLLVTGRAGPISDRIATLADSVFPARKPRVTACSFRHQFHADIRASGLTSAEASAAMGHCVDKTKGNYATARHARSGGAIRNVCSARVVKERARDKLDVLRASKSCGFENGSNDRPRNRG